MSSYASLHIFWRYIHIDYKLLIFEEKKKKKKLIKLCYDRRKKTRQLAEDKSIFFGKTFFFFLLTISNANKYLLDFIIFDESMEREKDVNYISWRHVRTDKLLMDYAMVSYHR